MDHQYVQNYVEHDSAIQKIRRTEDPKKFVLSFSSEEYLSRCKTVLTKRFLKCLAYLWITCWLGILMFMGSIQKGLGENHEFLEPPLDEMYNMTFRYHPVVMVTQCTSFGNYYLAVLNTNLNGEAETYCG
jgi:hypothetical protein